MLDFIQAKPRHVFKLRKTLKRKESKLFNFYSEDPGFIIPLILLGRCFLLERKESKGLLVFESSKSELHYLPLTRGLSFFDLLFAVYKNINFKCLSLNIVYHKLNLNQYRKYFNFKIKSDIKKMKLSIDYKQEIDVPPHLHGEIKMRTMKLNKDENIRVELQNLIFGNLLGRENLTLEEVLEEQKSPRFIGDKCFILEKGNKPIGYGQVINTGRQYYLVNFGIVPNERKKGLGMLFLKGILHECLKSNITELFLTVDNCNNSAVELYVKSGFKEINNEANIILIN